ncbi:MAG TPA: hypothetical protein VF097_04575 [Actinomycetota bacterium]
MAIKGKKRSRGGRSRARAVAPRPTLVVPKKPFFQRTWVRWSLIGLLVLTVSGLAFGVIAARRAAAEREAAQNEVERVGEELERAVAPVAQVSGQSLVVLPQLGATLLDIQAGEARERRVRRQIARWEEDLAATRDDLGAIETDRRDLRRSIERISGGLEFFQVLLQGVPALLDEEQEARVAEATVALQGDLQTAAGTVQSGYLIYLNERVDVELDEGTPGLQTELPGNNPFGVPGPGEVPIPEAPAPEPTG